MSVHNYDTARDYLGSKIDRPIGTGRATRIIRRTDDTIAIRYQATDVVTYHVDGSIVLDTGGWRTVTTKARFQEYTRGVRIYSDKGILYINPCSQDWSDSVASRRPWVDGIRLTIGADRGWTIEYPNGVEPSDETTKRKALRAMINDYARGFGAAVVAGEVGFPGNGDCWGCLMRNVAKPDDHFDHAMGVDHIFSHFKEKYYVPSLLLRAFGRRGNPAFCYQLAIDRKDGDMVAREIRWYLGKLTAQLLPEIR